MKLSRLPKREFDKIREGRKSELSCHKKKNRSEKINLVCSRDEVGNVVGGCCKTLFFSKDEMKQLVTADKKMLLMHNSISQLETDLRCAISNVYDNMNANVNIIDIYVKRPDVTNADEVELERTKITDQISQLVQRKGEKYEELKLYVELTEHEEMLETKYRHIKNTGVVNCCYDCNFRWYCDKCCFTLKRPHGDFRTCGITLMTRLLSPQNRSGRYGATSDEDIQCLQEHFKTDMKYGIHPDTLRGKSANMKELLKIKAV
jgi:hypothetical protein